MKNKRYLTTCGLTILLIFLMGLSSVQSAPPPTMVQPKVNALASVIEIGVLAPVSGELESLGQGLLDGVRAAAWEINQSDDFSFNITLNIQDSKATEADGIIAYNAVKAAGVQLIIGAAGSSASRAVAERAKDDHIPQISYASTAAMLSDSAYDYFWRTVPTDALQAEGLAALINDTGYEDIVIVHRGDDYGTGFGDGLKDSFRSMGGNVLTQISYLPGTTDFSVSVSTIKASITAEAIALIAYITDGGSFITEVREAGIDLPIYGTDGIADASLLNASHTTATIVQDAQYTLGTRPHSFAKGEGKFDDFNDSLQAIEAAGIAAYGGKISLFSDFAYDATMVGCLAIEEAGTYDGVKINAEIADVGKGYIGATGNKTFSNLGDVTQSSYDVWQFQDGEVIAVGNWTGADGIWLNTTKYVDPEDFQLQTTTTTATATTTTTEETTTTTTDAVATPGFEAIPTIAALFGIWIVVTQLRRRKHKK